MNRLDYTPKTEIVRGIKISYQHNTSSVFYWYNYKNINKIIVSSTDNPRSNLVAKFTVKMK